MNEEVKKIHPKRTNIVKKDAFTFFNSKEFVRVLEKTNTKLLWQSLSLFDNDSLYIDKTKKTIQNIEVNYKQPLPGIKKTMVNSVKKSIKKTIKRIKKKENKKLGKIYIAEDVKNHNIQFSGRKSKGLTLSGEYLSPGSKIPFSQVMGENKIIRLGIAWRGLDSCDIDHSINILDSEKYADTVFYGNPIYKKNGEIIISSSGDITTCGDDLFSTELIDIDLDLAIENGLGNMITSAIQYQGKNFDNYEVLWFMNIIDKKDRVIDNRKISIQLDQMNYAIQVNESTGEMLGFYIDLKEQFLEVLNISVKRDSNYSNSSISKEKFEKVLENREPLISLYDALRGVVKKKQIVNSIEEADVVIMSNLPKKEFKNKTYLSPGHEGEKIKEIIF